MVDRIVLTQDDIADDWVKTVSWGLVDVKTYEDFRREFPTAEQVGMFVQLPAWNPAPQAIKDGVAAEFPDLVPLFFTMPEAMVKHGDHDQLSHGNWAGVNRGTPEYEAKMRAVQAMKDSGKVFPDVDMSEVARLMDYGNLDYGSFDSEQYISDNMQFELDKEIQEQREQRAQEIADEMGEGEMEDYLDMVEDSYVTDLALGILESEAARRFNDELQDAGYDTDWEWNNAFSHMSADGRYEARAHSVDFDGSDENITVSGDIYIDGEYAGEFRRNIYPDDARYGGVHVHRDLFTVLPEHRGEGVAKWFNSTMENVYLASGVDVVSIFGVDLSHGDPKTAGGPSVWSSQGFDFDPYHGDTAYEQVYDAVMSYVDDNPEFGGQHREVQANIRDVAQRFANLDMNDPNFPTPREVWMLGRVGDINGRTGWWPGKAILGHGGASRSEAEQGGEEGPSAYFVMHLSDKGGKRVSQGQIEAKQVRERIARAAMTTRAEIEAGQQLLDVFSEFITVNGQPIPIEPDQPTAPESRVRFLGSRPAGPRDGGAATGRIDEVTGWKIREIG